ncbi:ABC transporter [Aspergillus sclerotialis]|uniref:ABC transporter n=1 Tax=Aspergillus sclerotialis TaxID=2070753 RepID=A0A3A2ZC25_9EURO|nr:ABC transporter [Aspergillus sclerotialis]
MLTRPGLWSRTGSRTRPLTLLLPSVRHLTYLPPLVDIKDGTFHQSPENTNPPVFTNLNFSLPGTKGGVTEKWAVIGSSSKTDFFNVLLGKYVCHPPNARSYPFYDSPDIAKRPPRYRPVGDPIQLIGFSGEGGATVGGTRGAYLSARFESRREETDWTLRQYLKGQTSLNPLEEDIKGKVTRDAQMARHVDNLGLRGLMNMPVANLSNGQMRRARIAKALLNRPDLLLLDDPFVGLDPAATRGISDVLFRLAVHSSPRLILGLRPQDSVPDWITHLIIFGDSNQVYFQGDKDSVIADLQKWSRHPVKHPPPVLQGQARKLLTGVHIQLLYDLNLLQNQTTPFNAPSPPEGDPLIEMEGVRVAYGDKPALGNWVQKLGNEKSDGLHWTVRRGQRWAILGANGSGKTTLLSLITSDHPQAYALPIRHFGRSRLPEPGKPAISLFELQSRIGHSSPEIHAIFPRQLTIREAIESAFADAFLSRPKMSRDDDLNVISVLRHFKSDLSPSHDNSVSPEPDEVNDQTKDFFPKLSKSRAKRSYVPEDHDIEYADSVRFGDLSTTQQRVVLFLRALIHKPDIILLDEAFAGMTTFLRDKCINFLEVGQNPSSKGVTAPRRVHKFPGQEKDPYESASQDIRHHGISDDQALIVISHVKEEIPDIVRHYVRLPSKAVGDGKRLSFTLGKLNSSSAISDPAVWDAAWSPDVHKHEHAVQAKKIAKEEAQKCHPDDEKYDWVYL